MGDALATGDLIPVLGATGLRMVAPSAVNAEPDAQAAAVAASLAALTARVVALEAKPSPIVRFSTSVTPGVLLVGTKLVTVTVPGILAGDILLPVPLADPPSGVSLLYARATAANTVVIAIGAVVAVTVNTSIAIALDALRG